MRLTLRLLGTEIFSITFDLDRVDDDQNEIDEPQDPGTTSSQIERADLASRLGFHCEPIPSLCPSDAEWNQPAPGPR